MKKIIPAILILGFLIYFLADFVEAEEEKVDYKKQVIVDNDLDGLTDEGEKQIFKTDFLNPDTDGDGIFDGAEIINKTNPLDATSPTAAETTLQSIYTEQKEIAWAWYATRASALIAFLLLYISIFFGLSLRIPFLNKIIKPVYSLENHCWISVVALVFSAIHGGSLLFDKFLKFSFGDILLPFYSDYEPFLTGLGIISFYFIVILTVTSYLKKYFSQKLWRFLHSLNILLYAFAIIHSLYLGTDMKITAVKNIFIGANLFLAILFVINIFIRIYIFFKCKYDKQGEEKDICKNPPEIGYE
jgi:hypothetical protein